MNAPVMMQGHIPNDGETHAVLAFLLGNRLSGPRMMTVRSEGTEADDVSVAEVESVFQPGTTIQRTRIEVNGRLYLVYFDCPSHQQDRENGSYLFLRMTNWGRAENLRPEDDIMDIMEVLDRLDRLFPPSVGVRDA